MQFISNLVFKALLSIFVILFWHFTFKLSDEHFMLVLQLLWLLSAVYAIHGVLDDLTYDTRVAAVKELKMEQAARYFIFLKMQQENERLATSIDEFMNVFSYCSDDLPAELEEIFQLELELAFLEHVNAICEDFILAEEALKQKLQEDFLLELNQELDDLESFDDSEEE